MLSRCFKTDSHRPATGATMNLKIRVFCTSFSAIEKTLIATVKSDIFNLLFTYYAIFFFLMIIVLTMSHWSNLSAGGRIVNCYFFCWSHKHLSIFITQIVSKHSRNTNNATKRPTLCHCNKHFSHHYLIMYDIWY